MIKPAGIDHIVLRTSQLEAMRAFFCGVLNCTVERETSADIGLTQLRAGYALIDLVSVDSELGRMGGGPPTKSDNNLDHFCLQLQAISEQDITAHLQAHGIAVAEFKNRYGAQGFGRSVYVNDPDGNVVELRSVQ
jgi:glyoxylase I family protein